MDLTVLFVVILIGLGVPLRNRFIRKFRKEKNID